MESKLEKQLICMYAIKRDDSQGILGYIRQCLKMKNKKKILVQILLQCKKKINGLF